MQFIETKDAPLPSGHYSQAVVVDGAIYVAGLLPIIPGTHTELPAGIVAQTEQVFRNLQAVLLAAKSDLYHVVNLQLFVPSIESWSVVDKICKQSLGSHKPARTIIPCGPLHYGALIEANAIARVS